MITNTFNKSSFVNWLKQLGRNPFGTDGATALVKVIHENHNIPLQELDLEASNRKGHNKWLLDF